MIVALVDLVNLLIVELTGIAWFSVTLLQITFCRCNFKNGCPPPFLIIKLWRSIPKPFEDFTSVTLLVSHGRAAPISNTLVVSIVI